MKINLYFCYIRKRKLNLYKWEGGNIKFRNYKNQMSYKMKIIAINIIYLYVFMAQQSAAGKYNRNTIICYLYIHKKV